MELKEAIYSRRSVRNYTDEVVEKDLINNLLDAAVQAPSAMNSQPWEFSVIQEKELLENISTRTKAFMLESLAENPEFERYKNNLSNPAFNIFYNSNTLITVYSKANGLRNIDDCSLAAQNIMLTAYSLGLGSCWVGFAEIFLNTEIMKKELNIPSGYTVVAPIIIGHPASNNIIIPKKEPKILFWK